MHLSFDLESPSYFGVSQQILVVVLVRVVAAGRRMGRAKLHLLLLLLPASLALHGAWFGRSHTVAFRPRIILAESQTLDVEAHVAASDQPAASNEPMQNAWAAAAGGTGTKMTYDARDGVDYMLMLGVFQLASHACFRRAGLVWLRAITGALSVFLAGSFVWRHGFRPALPIPLAQPWSVPAALADRFLHLSPLVALRAALALGETLLIGATPRWQHRARLMEGVGVALLLGHLACTTAFRTWILGAHLRNLPAVRHALARTSWRPELDRTALPLLLAHGWATGLAANLAAIMPWAALLAARQQSLLLLPLALVADTACTGVHRGSE